jgi:hypothetical protein
MSSWLILFIKKSPQLRAFSRMHKLERKPPFTQYSHVIDGTIAGEEIVSYAKSGISEIHKKKPSIEGFII